MPTYEYVCDQCGHAFDEMQSFKDEPLKVCPKCHQETLRRLFGTGAAILFKGSGFYSTDYGRGSRKKDPSTDGAGGDSDSGSKKDSDKKPETKAAET